MAPFRALDDNWMTSLRRRQRPPPVRGSGLGRGNSPWHEIDGRGAKARVQAKNS